MNVLRIETDRDDGMSIGEFKKALTRAEALGMTDDDVVRVDVMLSLSSNGAPVKRVYVPVGD